jgi:hypothetical protein
MNEAGAKLGAAIGMAIARHRAEHQQEKNDLTAVVFCRQNPTGNWTFPNKAPMPCQTLSKNVVAYCTVNAKTHLCKDVAKLPPPAAGNVSSSRLSEDDRFTWQWYSGLPEDDKKYVSEFCPANPSGKALLPRARVNAGEPAERALYCKPWLSAAHQLQPQTQALIQPQPQPQPQPQQVSVTPPPAQNSGVLQPQSQTQLQTQPPTQMLNVSAASAPEEISVAEAARRNKAAKEAQKTKENTQAQAQPRPQQ